MQEVQTLLVLEGSNQFHAWQLYLSIRVKQLKLVESMLLHEYVSLFPYLCDFLRVADFDCIALLTLGVLHFEDFSEVPGPHFLDYLKVLMKPEFLLPLTQLCIQVFLSLIAFRLMPWPILPLAL